MCARNVRIRRARRRERPFCRLVLNQGFPKYGDFAHFLRMLAQVPHELIHLRSKMHSAGLIARPATNIGADLGKPVEIANARLDERFSCRIDHERMMNKIRRTVKRPSSF